MNRPDARTGTARFVGGLVTLAGVFILGVWLYGSWRVTPHPISKTAVPLSMTQPTLDSAKEVIARYFEAGTDEARIACLHEKDRVGPLWRDFYHRRAKPFPLLDSIQAGKLVTHEEKTLALFVIELSPGGRQPIALFWEADHFMIDWESHVAYGTMDWIEWVESKPTEPQTLRVYLSETNIGNERAGDRQVAVEHHDALAPELAVIPKTIDFPINFIGRQRVPVTAEFQFQERSGNRILVLTRLIHEGWSR